MTKAIKKNERRQKERAEPKKEPPENISAPGEDPTAERGHERDHLPRVLTGPQCRAKRSNGLPCKNRPVKGAAVCRIHGGGAPQVQKSAKQRLLELVNPALAELHRILEDKKSDDHVKIKAIQTVLDRTGFARGVQISVETRAWDEAVTESIDLDRTGIQVGYGKAGAVDGGGDDDAMELEQKAYAAYKLAEDARSEAWAETDWDAEDAPPDHPYRDEHTVQGEVVDEQRGEPIPPGYYRDDEVRRAEGGPRRRR